MRETTNKYKLPVHFSEGKLASWPFAAIYIWNVFITPFYFNLPTKLILKY